MRVFKGCSVLKAYFCMSFIAATRAEGGLVTIDKESTLILYWLVAVLPRVKLRVAVSVLVQLMST